MTHGYMPCDQLRYKLPWRLSFSVVTLAHPGATLLLPVRECLFEKMRRDSGAIDNILSIITIITYIEIIYCQ